MNAHDSYAILLKVIPLLFLLVFISLSKKKGKIKPVPLYLAVVFVVLYALLMGFSPLDFGTDKPGNTYIFKNIHLYETNGFKDPGWIYLVKFEKLIFGNSVSFFFFFTAAIYCALYFFTGINIFPKEYFPYFLVFAFGTLGFVNHGVNVIRAGLSISLCLFGIGTEKRAFRVISFLIALSIQKYCILLVAAYYLCKYVKKNWLFEVGWLVCLVVSFTNVISLADYATMIDVTDTRTLGYLDGGYTYYKVGFRYDFILYSFFPLISAFYFINRKQFKEDFYVFIYRIYLTANMVWLLVIRMPYTDRVAYYSWCMIPIIFVYPLVSSNKLFVSQQTVLFGITMLYIVFNFAI